MLRLFYILLLATMSVLLYAQESISPTLKPVPNIVTATDFLGEDYPKRTWDLITDSLDFVYMIKERHISRFDGDEVKRLSLPKGHKPNQYQHFSKGAEGDLWTYSLYRVARIVGDSLFPQDDFETGIANMKVELQTFYRDADGLFHMGLNEKGYYTRTAHGEMQEEVGLSSGMHGFCLVQLPDNSWFVFSIRQEGVEDMPSIYILENGEPQKIATSQVPWPQLRPHPIFNIIPSVQQLREGTLLVSIGGKEVFYIKDNQLLQTRKFDWKILNLFVDRQEVLWIGSVDRGLFKVISDDLQKVQNFLPGNMGFITCEDSRGRLWINSGQEAFACITHPYSLHYSKDNGCDALQSIIDIGLTQEGVYCFAPPNGFYALGDTIRYIPTPPRQHKLGNFNWDKYPTYIHSQSNGHTLWLGYVADLLAWNGSEWSQYYLDTIVFEKLFVRHLATASDGTLEGCTADRLFELKDGEVVTTSKKSEKRLISFVRDSSEQLWVLRTDGLVKLVDDEFERPDFLKEGELVSTGNYVTWSQNALWVQCLGTSLHCVLKDKVIPVIDRNGKPLLTSCFSTVGDELWCIVDNGDRFELCEIVLKGDNPIVSYYEIDDDAKKGPPIYKNIRVTDSQVFISSKEGLFCVSKADLQEFNKLDLLVSELRINHQGVERASVYDLRYDENYLSFLFDGTNFSRERTEYRYKLAGLDSVRTSSIYKQVQYTNLDPGQYKFMVQAKTKDGLEDWGNAEVITFKIGKPYWETWWFRIGVIVLVLALVFTLMLIRERRLTARGKIKLEMSRLELRALKAQINPHFIFNAMSSATYYLSKNQADKARNYLVRFSRLIRMVLENSEKSNVRLEDELTMIRQYIALESEKFEEGSIDFQVSMQNDMLNDIEIPSALFQPYIENAIWHGLKAKQGERTIKLTCYQEQEVLYIEIEDNGIGRRAAAQLHSGKKHHKSFGMMIASRRIELLNNRKLAVVKVDDLEDAQGKPKGTKVRFGIPINAMIHVNPEIEFRAG